MPGSRWSGLARVGQHRLSSGSAHGLLGVAQACSAPSDTSRDSQFESASSKCEPPPRGWFIGRFMAQEWVYWPNNGHCSACHTKSLSVTRRQLYCLKLARQVLPSLSPSRRPSRMQVVGCRARFLHVGGVTGMGGPHCGFRGYMQESSVLTLPKKFGNPLNN